MAEPRALPSRQKPENDLSDDERREKLALIPPVEQPDQSNYRVEHIGVDRADVYRFYARGAFFRFDIGFHHDRGDEGRIEVQPATKIRSFFRRFFYLEDDRQIDRKN